MNTITYELEVGSTPVALRAEDEDPYMAHRIDLYAGDGTTPNTAVLFTAQNPDVDETNGMPITIGDSYSYDEILKDPRGGYNMHTFYIMAPSGTQKVRVTAVMVQP